MKMKKIGRIEISLTIDYLNRFRFSFLKRVSKLEENEYD